mmetsp:Transcript_59219/g.166741  ORF Transcript_59219/g.166741 Transcript_59219/m.166741 type:complete len:245 (+) Transcript_59219:185-919(+)
MLTDSAPISTSISASGPKNVKKLRKLTWEGRAAAILATKPRRSSAGSTAFSSWGTCCSCSRLRKPASSSSRQKKTRRSSSSSRSSRPSLQARPRWRRRAAMFRRSRMRCTNVANSSKLRSPLLSTSISSKRHLISHCSSRLRGWIPKLPRSWEISATSITMFRFVSTWLNSCLRWNCSRAILFFRRCRTSARYSRKLTLPSLSASAWQKAAKATCCRSSSRSKSPSSRRSMETTLQGSCPSCSP